MTAKMRSTGRAQDLREGPERVTTALYFDPAEAERVRDAITEALEAGSERIVLWVGREDRRTYVKWSAHAGATA